MLSRTQFTGRVSLNIFRITGCSPNLSFTDDPMLDLVISEVFTKARSCVPPLLRLCLKPCSC